MARPLSPLRHAPRYFGAPVALCDARRGPVSQEKTRGPRPVVVRTSQGRLSVAVAVAVAVSKQHSGCPSPAPRRAEEQSSGRLGLAGWLRGVVARYPPPRPSVCFNRVCRV